MVRLVGRGALLRALLAAVVADLAGIALLGIATWLLLRAGQRPELAALSLAIAGVRAAAMVRGFARYGERLTGHDAALGALATLRDRVYRALSGQSPAALANRTGADALTAVVSDVDAVQDLVVRCLLPMAGTAVVAVASITAVTLVAPAAGLVLAVGLVLASTAVPWLAARRSVRSDRLIAADRAELATGIADLVHGSAELAAYADGPDDAYATVLGRVRAVDARLTARQRSAPAAGAAALVLLLAGLTALGVLLAGLATASGITVLVLPLLALAAFDGCAGLPAAARKLAEIAGSARRLAAVGQLGQPAEPVVRQAMTVPGQAPELRAPELRVRDLTVRYPDAAEPALAEVDLRLRPGGRIAIVGASGSGKSTLLAALVGFVRPTGGQITLAGQDLADWPDPALRNTISGVLADTHVFHDTVEQNLRIARPDATHEELVRAAARARLLDWIESLPAGWQTVLSSDASFASGGQRQRLLLARALLADTPVLLLDEPTEGLDPETADAVLADVLAATEGSGTILVTHRLTGLAELDEVLVLDAGRVRQRGRHAELIARPGPYRDLWRMRELVE